MGEQLVMEETATTASFVITVGLLFWIKQEAARRSTNASALLREILESARSERESAVA